MVFQFKFPDVGEGITEGVIVSWKVKVGDVVKNDQVIAEVETDKAVVEIPCPHGGKIVKINHKEGETINVGEVLVEFDDGKTVEKKEVEKEKPKKGKKKEHYTGSVIGYLEEAKEVVKEEKISSKKKAGKKVRATPKIRRIAKKLGVDLNSVTGTGPSGRITEADLKKPKIGKKRAKVKIKGKVDRIPFKGVRKTIADNLFESQKSTVSVTNFYDVDVTELWDLRKKEKIKAEKKGIKLTFLPFIIKAVALTLMKHPKVNSSLDADEIVLKKYYNIGFAVDTINGLIVPVLKNADKMSVIKIAKQIGEMAGKARERTISREDMKGGTFTVTNLGSIGVKYFTPVINHPESAILGLGRIEDTPTVIAGNIVIRKSMPVSFTYDHRVVDGADAARFMVDLMHMLEEPKLIK